jgi:hypothetical protein
VGHRVAVAIDASWLDPSRATVFRVMRPVVEMTGLKDPENEVEATMP